jgi:penicillin-binding protein 1A
MSKSKRTSDILKKRAKRQRKGIFRKLFLWSLLLGFVLLFFGALTGVATFYYLSQDLPQISTLTDYKPSIITTVYSDDGRKIAEFSKERRIIIPLDEMPQMLLDAFIAAEDARFYKHKGIDVYSIIRALFKNIEAGTIVQGGSTKALMCTASFGLYSKTSKPAPSFKAAAPSPSRSPNRFS